MSRFKLAQHATRCIRHVSGENVDFTARLDFVLARTSGRQPFHASFLPVSLTLFFLMNNAGKKEKGIVSTSLSLSLLYVAWHFCVRIEMKLSIKCPYLAVTRVVSPASGRRQNCMNDITAECVQCSREQKKRRKSKLIKISSSVEWKITANDCTYCALYSIRTFCNNFF